MKFLLTARNATTPDAFEIRDRLRPDHLKTIDVMARDGSMVFGGATLDADGRPDGSVAILDFPDRTALNRWLETHPYQRQGVWESVEVIQVQAAPAFRRR